jgi:hypothetical protein
MKCFLVLFRVENESHFNTLIITDLIFEWLLVVIIFMFVK